MMLHGVNGNISCFSGDAAGSIPVGATNKGMNMLIVNMFGGPGCGKSTTAAGVFSRLKLDGYNVEYVSEFAKDLTWEQRSETLGNQIYIFAKQYHRLWRLTNKVDIVVTDSPLIMSLAYGNPTQALIDLTVESFDSFNNINFMIDRVKGYNPKGRNQTEEQAIEKDIEIKNILELYTQSGIEYFAKGDKTGIEDVYQILRLNFLINK